MARVLILSQFHPPETGAGARRVAAMARALAARHAVTVQTLLPAYPREDLFEGLEIGPMDSQMPYVVRRAFKFQPYDRSLLRRTLREMLMGLRLAREAEQVEADALLVSTPSMFLAPPAWWMARRRRIPWVWDLRDLTWRYGRESVDAGRVQRIASRLLEGWMARLLNAADAVVTTAEATGTYLQDRYGLPGERTLTVYNGVSEAFFGAFEGEVTAKPPGERPLVLYLGLLGHNHGMDILVDVAAQMPDVEFLIVGEGTERELIERRARERGVQNLRIEGYRIRDEEIQEIYRRADVLFNHSKDRPVLNEARIPAKFFEYMATGKPMIYAGRGFAAEFIQEVGCAEVVPPEDPQAVVEAIRRILADPAQAAVMGARGRECVRAGYMRENQMAALCRELERRGILAEG